MKKVFAILFVTAMTALCLVPSASFADSGYGYTEAYDSFIVSEEYRTMAEEVDLVGMMKEKYPEMDGETLYRARYDAMQVAWEAIGSFADDLKKGEVTRNEKTLRFVSLTVPIVEDESGSCIASAQIDRNGEVEISLHPNGTIVTRQQYDESLCSDGDALPKGYTVLYFHYDIPEAVRKYLMVYTDHEILFYDLSFGWDETGPTKVPYTAQRLGETLAGQPKESAWVFFTTIVLPAIGAVIATLVVPVTIILLLIWRMCYLRRKKHPKNCTEAIETAEDDGGV